MSAKADWPPKPLNGKGPRPADPYVRIVWASERGLGCTLSADEVGRMSIDDAIATRAYLVATGDA